MLRLLATPHKDMYGLTQDELDQSRLAKQIGSGGELVTEAKSDDWVIASAKATASVVKLLRDSPKEEHRVE